jgi:CBS domain containing-hemolysin-like protein
MTPWLLAAGGLPAAAPQLDPWSGLALGLFLVLLNGFFVAAEFALVKVRPTQLDPEVQQGSRAGRVARHMVQHLDAYLSATQLGITLTSLALGWVGEPAFTWVLTPLLARLPGASPELVHTLSLSAAFAVITVLHIVLGELAPKSMAIRLPKPTTLAIAFPLYAFYKATYPVIWLLNRTANGLLRLVGIQPVGEHALGHDEEELRRLLAGSGDAQLSAEKRELLDSVFELSHRVARQVMVPRGDVVHLDTTRPIEENLALARRSGHTRFPLCAGSLDQVVGMVHIKDLFRRERPPRQLDEVRREIAFVPETLTLDRLLKRMRAERLHMAAVLDEWGGVSGIVTLENVIEEIVGQIQDEFDTEKPELVAAGEGVYLVAGAMLVVDLERALDLEISHRNADTIAGVVLEELGQPPRVGDRVRVGPLEFEVLDVKQNRIRNLRASRPAVAATGPPSPQDSGA